MVYKFLPNISGRKLITYFKSSSATAEHNAGVLFQSSILIRNGFLFNLTLLGFRMDTTITLMET